jgi:predicted dithiol-disulfide oxidoreductase (DUF899 family)
MNITRTGSRGEWLAARLDLLAKEKAASRQLAALTEQHRALPAVAVAVDKDYVFEGPDRKVSLIDLFADRSELFVYHFMWLHDIDEGCPCYSFAVDDLPDPIHLNEGGADTTLHWVARAPYARAHEFKDRTGWTLPWYSSHGSDFNYDFHVTMDESVRPAVYNYRDKADHEQAGMPWYTKGEQSGLSVFLRDGDDIFHTYSTYARGVDKLAFTRNFLDLTPLGRQQDDLSYVARSR